MCRLSIRRFILLLVSCLVTPKAGSGPANWWTVPSLVISSAISFPPLQEYLGTQKSPTEWWVEMSFSAFWHCCTSGNIVLAAWRAFKATWLREQILTFFWSVIHLSFVSTFCILHQCIFYFEMYLVCIYNCCAFHIPPLFISYRSPW